MYCRNCGTPSFDTPEQDSKPFWEPDLCLACHHKPTIGTHFNYLTGSRLPRQTVTMPATVGTQTDEPYQLLTFNEAMNFLKVSRSTLLRLLREEKLHGYKVGTRWRFTLTQLKECVKPI